MMSNRNTTKCIYICIYTNDNNQKIKNPKLRTSGKTLLIVFQNYHFWKFFLKGIFLRVKTLGKDLQVFPFLFPHKFTKNIKWFLTGC